MDVNSLAMMVALAIGAVVLFLLIAVGILLVVLRRRPKETPREEVDQAIDLLSLSVSNPAVDGPQLECYGTPVRLAVLVLAPVGRGGTIPDTDQLLKVVDQLIPGLVDVVSVHQPVVRFWPPQLSSQGFMNSFFHNVRLPGDRGRDTPWCGMAGKFSAPGGQYLAGLICRAEESNGLSAIAVQHNGQWHDILRVKS